MKNKRVKRTMALNMLTLKEKKRHVLVFQSAAWLERKANIEARLTKKE